MFRTEHRPQTRPTVHERANTRVEAGWRGVLLMSVVAPSLVVVALAVSEYPALVAGVVAGLLLPGVVQVARRAVRQLATVVHSALDGARSESSLGDAY